MASPQHHAVLARATDPPSTASNSLSGLVSTLIPTAIVAAVFFVLFLLLRRSQRRQYSPRTYLGTLREQERSPTLPSGLFNWVGAVMKIPDTYVLNHHSLDGYLLLRFLKLTATIAFVGCCITWPVLLPVNATGGNGGQQLDMLTMSNVVDKKRYYAHALVSWLFFGFVILTVTRESLFYINLRQAYLLSPLYANRISSRTVLFTSVPDAFLHEGKLRRVLGRGLKNLWISSDTKQVDELVKERDKVATKLEAAETKLVKAANASRIKQSKKKGGATAAAPDAEAGGPRTDFSEHLIQKDRPSHRLKPVIGKKVDTIDWCRSELERILPKVEEAQATHRSGSARLLPSVFAEFTTQNEAQAALQSLTHHQPLHMAPRYVGISPEDVIWSNLRIRWWERVLRGLAANAFVSALIVFWAIPVAVVGAISNINYLTTKLPWLGFINDIPPVILGVVTGLLPVVALAVLMALLPIILRLVAKHSGAPSLSRVELTVQNSYFAFQVVQVFLVVTLASAASAVVQEVIAKPDKAVDLLATNLPKASNFYLSYFILQGLVISSGALLQIVGLILGRVLGMFLDNTPRKIYKRWATLSGVGWGTVFPPFTLLLVIAITYSCIAPLVLGFATVGLYLIYLAFRYNFLFVVNATIDTKGLVYARALQHTMTGVYLGEVCLIGLFGIGKAPGPLILEVVLLIFTILYHMSLNSALGPMLQYLPKTLATEEEALLALEDGHGAEKAVGADGHDGQGTKTTATLVKDDAEATAAPIKKPNFFTRWLRPDKYDDFHTLRRLVPQGFAEIVYTPEAERDAYYDPAISSPTPLLWIPRDPMGVSAREVEHTSRVIPITDEGATLDDKNKIVTDQESQPPIHQEKVYY
ncbi:MAG: hypothetical protein M1832_006126 [Thelocarpon impressellum]|nr:MAG: hypothetical protein M1832_006126 [Thelocarpon impressellum]